MIISGALPLKRFNSVGSRAYAELMRERPGDLFIRLEALANDQGCSEDLGFTLNWRKVTNRFELGSVLWEAFGLDMPLDKYAGDSYAWNWLSAALYETLVGGDMRYVAKKRKEEIERWVLTESSRSYHRHLVSGPLFVFRNNWPNIEKAMCMLAESNRPKKGEIPLLTFSEVHERMTGKRELAYGSVAHLGTLLYVDPKTKKLRDNLSDKPGEPQQLSTFFKQLDLTVDYESMSARELLDFVGRLKNFAPLVEQVRKENPNL
jgi:hypothetical protein